MSTMISTANLRPIQDFTPEKQSPSFSGQINQSTTVTTVAAGAQTITAAQILGGLYIGVPTGAANYTTDTAANIVKAIEGAKVGTSINFVLRNKSAGANTITLVAGTGVTINSGDTATVAQSNQKQFRLVVTAIGDTPTITVYSMGTVVY